jgi:hypothetical protein
MHPSTSSAVIHVDATSKPRTIGMSCIRAASSYTYFVPSHHSAAFRQPEQFPHPLVQRRQGAVPCGENTLGRRRQLSKQLMLRRKADENDTNGTGDEKRTISTKTTKRKIMTTSTASARRIADGRAILGACLFPLFLLQNVYIVLSCPTCTQILRIR